jgi:methylase of polypeptide subunit release factors
MKDASEYGDYNEKLAERIAPYLTKESRICDAGCGLGYLSLALSHYAGCVTAVDINENALDILKENLRKRRIDNINICCSDISDVHVEPFDNMVFCFFGNIQDISLFQREAVQARYS